MLQPTTAAAKASRKSNKSKGRDSEPAGVPVLSPAAMIDHLIPKEKEGNNNVDKYRAMVESYKPLGFTGALELECARIQLGLDEHTRDNVCTRSPSCYVQGEY